MRGSSNQDGQQQQQQQQEQPGQAYAPGADASLTSALVPIVAVSTQAVPSSSSTIATPATSSVRRSSQSSSPFITSARRPRRLNLSTSDTSEAVVPPSSSTSGGDEGSSDAVSIPLQSSNLPPPPPPTPTITATRGRGRGRGRGRRGLTQFGQLMALNSANDILAVQAETQCQSEDGFEPTIFNPNPEQQQQSPSSSSAHGSARSTRSSSAAGRNQTSETAGTPPTADKVARWGALAQFGGRTSSRPRQSDNVILNLERPQPPFITSRRTPRASGSSSFFVPMDEATVAAAMANVVAQSKARRRASNNVPLIEGAMSLFENASSSSAPTSRRRQTRSASAAAAVSAAAVEAITGSAMGEDGSSGGSGNMTFSRRGDVTSSTSQSTQFSPYPSPQSTRGRGRRSRGGRGDTNLDATDRSPLSPLSTKAIGDADVTMGSSSLVAATSSSIVSRAGFKRSHIEMVSESNGGQNAGVDGNSDKTSSGGAASYESFVREDRVMNFGGTHVDDDEQIGKTTHGDQVAQNAQTVQVAQAAQAGGLAFDVIPSVNPVTGAMAYSFRLPPGIDPNFPLGFNGIVNIPLPAGSTESTGGSATLATAPAESSLAFSSESPTLLAAVPATTAFTEGFSAARRAVSNTAKSIIDNLCGFNVPHETTIATPPATGNETSNTGQNSTEGPTSAASPQSSSESWITARLIGSNSSPLQPSGSTSRCDSPAQSGAASDADAGAGVGGASDVNEP
ncbi:hypothetical protein BGZ96_009583 [Linnemannia gamsii]|uniref:Uncharacterized protein n=1 Tax=Linnemannia gamsii TaxID=64522 RepID=A0ABQ7JW67_9FUNG|nr:hypothetical protein BGZ96_009583 [Linnemannia gamsii]